MDLACVTTLLDRANQLVSDRDLWQLTDDESTELHEVLRETDRLLGFATAQALYDVEFRGVPYAAGFQTTESWLAATQRLNLGTARAEVKVARAVATEQFPTVTEAWADGHLDVDRVEVIVDVVNKLEREDVPEVQRATAEELMASHAAQLSPSELTKVGKEIKARLVEHDAPAEDDPEERRFTVSRTGIGRSFGVLNGTTDQVGAEILETALDAFGAQRCDNPGLSEAQRRGEALIALAQFGLENMTATGPGASARQLIATVPWATLTGGCGSGTLDRTGPVSGRVARQLACDADVTIVVTGQKGEVLDVGRTRRLVTKRLRNALVVRDGGCVWPYCHRPSSQTEAHHLVPWAAGGQTSLENLASFCAAHHHLLHAGKGWEAGLVDGIPFVRDVRRGVRPPALGDFHPRFLAQRVALAGPGL